MSGAAAIGGAMLASGTAHAARSERRAHGGDGLADLVLRNGRVHTVDAARPWAEALAVRGGVLTYVGAENGVDAHVGPGTRVLDLGGRLVLPGFQDGHTHIHEASSPTFTCTLDPAASMREQIPAIRRGRPRGTDFVLGWGYSVDVVTEEIRNGESPREVLDVAVPDHPALMMEQTSHSTWVNSLALERAGITVDTPNPPGGVIVRDGDGEPNGLLIDAASDLVLDVALARTDELVALQADGLRNGLRELARHGITSVADARVYRNRSDLQVWRRADDEGWLTARAVLGVWAHSSHDDDTQLAELADLYDPAPGGLLRVSQVKLISDGLTANGSAALLEPYESAFLDRMAPLGLGSDVGLNYFDAARLARYVTELERVGYDVHVHVIGDRGAREALDAVESGIATNGPGVDRRHRLTHLELVDAADIPRFAGLGVIADVQVTGEWTLPDHWPDNEQYIGDRARRFIPLRELYEADAHVTLSSDWDVSTMNPLVGIQHALTRDPQSLPDLATAVRAYTLAPAYALRQERTTGSLEVGKLADLVVLDENVFDLPVTQIAQASVVLTYLGGEEIYRGRGAP